MASLRTALLSSCIAAAAALPSPPSRHSRRDTTTNGVEWGPCQEPEFAEGVTAVPVQCGTLSVPRDYLDDNSTATIDLKLLKVPAVVDEPKGSLLFNPGGPGVPGRWDMARKASEHLIMTGGSYDLIGFDPRGIGEVMAFSCYGSDEERNTAAVAYPWAQELSDTHDASIGESWARASVFAGSCALQEEAKETAGLISTAYTARDVVQMAETLDDDGLVRYWGVSYGTILGAALVSMFPEKMDRVILDGVANPWDWFFGQDIQIFSDYDETFSLFFQECLDAPETCVIAQDHPDATAAELEHALLDIFEALKREPIYYPEGNMLITWDAVSSLIRQSFGTALTWPSLAVSLNGLLTGNLTATVDEWLRITAGGTGDDAGDGEAQDPEEEEAPSATESHKSPEGPMAIRCGDKSQRFADLADFRSTYQDAIATSRVGGAAQSQILGVCAQWPFEAKERPVRGFDDIQTKTPVLLLSSRYDPITSIVGARNVTAGLDESVLLETVAYGHGAVWSPSACTAKVMAEYLDDGRLPEQGTICDDAVPPFSGITWEEIAKDITE